MGTLSIIILKLDPSRSSFYILFLLCTDMRRDTYTYKEVFFIYFVNVKVD